MMIEMVDGEPPLFDCPQLDAMRIIRDELVPTLQNPEQVFIFLIIRHVVMIYITQVSTLLLNFLSHMLVKDPSQRSTASELLQHSFLAKTASLKSLVATMRMRSSHMTSSAPLLDICHQKQTVC